MYILEDSVLASTIKITFIVSILISSITDNLTLL